MRRLAGLCLAAAVLAGQAFAAFSDLPQTHWANEAVAQMAEQGILEGYPDGTFRPDETLTRAQFLAMVVRAWWPEEVGQPTDGDWWRPYYTLAQQKGLLQCGDGMDFVQADKVALDNPITRFEMATVLYHVGQTLSVHQIPASEVSFSDADFFPERYLYSVEWVTEVGLLNGYPDGSFSGDRSLKRSEGAAAVQRLLARKALTDEDTLIAGSGQILLTYVQTQTGITVTSRDVADGDVLQSLEVRLDTSRVEQADLPYFQSWAVLGANDHAFWGTAGYFTYDEDGTITQVTDRAVIDAKESSKGSVVAITCEPGTCVGYYGMGVLNPAGDQVVRISENGTISMLLDNEPAHGLTLAEVTGAESGDIRVTSCYVMGMADMHRYEYLIEHGKLWALEHIPGMGFSGFTPEEAEKEQQRLDDAGCGLGTIHST